MNWHIEKRKLFDLIPYPDNPRIIKGKQFDDLKKSVDKFGLAEPLCVNTDLTIIGGHARYLALKERGIKEIDCYLPDRQLTDKEVQELNIRLNKNISGEFDFDILANKFEIPELIEWGFEPFELGMLENKDREVDENLKTETECPKCGYQW